MSKEQLNNGNVEIKCDGCGSTDSLKFFVVNDGLYGLDEHLCLECLKKLLTPPKGDEGGADE